MTAFDDTDWSRWLLGACSSGNTLRSAVVRNAEQVKALRARVAELERELEQDLRGGSPPPYTHGRPVQVVGLPPVPEPEP